MKTRYWIIILTALTLVSGLCAGYFFLWHDGGHIVGVFSDGELVYTADMSEVRKDLHGITVHVTSKNGENTVLIDGDGIRIISATCPDKLCVKQGALSGAEPIVCLPNKVVIRYIDAEDVEFDASA